MLRIGFRGPFYYNYDKEPQNGTGQTDTWTDKHICLSVDIHTQYLCIDAQIQIYIQLHARTRTRSMAHTHAHKHTLT